MNPVRDEVTEKLDMQELPVVKGWFRLTFRACIRAGPTGAVWIFVEFG